MPAPTIERKIHFYRANLGHDAGGQLRPFDPTPALGHLDQLPFNPTGRYLDEGETCLCCWVDRVKANHRFRLAQIRRAGLPQLERNGQLSDLNIPDDSGLAETIHIVVFPDNIVGSDFNFFGPRMSRLSLYLKEKAARLCPEVTFEPLLRRDVTAALAKLEDIRMFNLKIRASYAARVTEADADLGSAFEAAQRAGQAEELEIVLRPSRHARKPLSDRLLGIAKKLVGLPDLQTEALKFQIKGTASDSNKVELVDLLADQLIVRAQVMRQSKRGRTLDTRSAYKAIQQAHEDLKDELYLAAGLVN